MIMMQAAQEEEVMTSKDQSHVMKGKRTKRQRPLSPALALAMVSSTSSSAAESESGGGERFSDNSGVGVGVDRVMRAASPTTSVEFSTSSEEEEDMANCLILLAQGNSNKKKLSPSSPSEPSADVIATTSNNKVAAGLYVYQCKTCNRCFPSFQALGGHRASHKKPKASVNEEKKTLMVIEEDKDHHRFNSMSTTLSLQIANRTAVAFAGNSNSSSINKTNKVHECSICGAEFSSGQALGGHMRRHRAFTNTTTTTTTMTAATTGLSMAASGSLDHHHQSREAKKPRNILQLDLNLPAPEDDRRESKFAFASQEQVIVFSASSLVDCHY